MIDLIANKLLRPFGYKLEKFEGKVKIRGFFGSKRFNVGNYTIKSPKSHTLSKNLNQFKFYSRNLPRLIQYVSEYYPDMEIIDVGANIGDSAALINSISNKPKKIYCFEGDTEYLKYLYENTSGMDNIEVFETFLGETIFLDGFNIVKDGGTLRIVENNCGHSIKINTLDDIYEKKQELKNVKFLKTDTDGYDFKIIRGSLKLIAEIKPILFFEYDRMFLNENGDDGFSTIAILNKLGYENAIVYDNYGRLLLSFAISNILILKQLDLYISDKKGAFPYYDICLFHNNDSIIFESILDSEMIFFNKQ